MEAHPNDRWLTERLHKPVCDWLQGHVEEWERWRKKGIKKRKKIALVIPRNFGKTVICTKALSLWAHVRNPDLATCIGSEVSTKAQDFLAPIRSLLEGDDPHGWFTWLYGNWHNPDLTWNNGTIVHGARKSIGRSEPSFTTFGIEGGQTGKHPDWGVIDDPLSEEKIRDAGTWLQTVNQAIAALRPAFRTDSFFVLALTRYRDNDVIGTHVVADGVRSWTGMPSTDPRLQVREDGEWDVYFLQSYDKEGQSIFPEMWPTEQLKAYETSRPVEFASQMMNEPGSGEHMPLTSEQIDQMWINPQDLPSQMKITIHTDTAFKSEKTVGKGDESVIEVWGHDPRGNGDVYFLEGYGNDSWRIEEFLDKLVSLVQGYKARGKRVTCITDDKLQMGKTGAYTNLLRSWFNGAGLVCPPLVELPRQGSRKINRIREAAGFWVDGHVKIVRGAPGAAKLINQMLRIGVSSFDDWADAAADVFAEQVYRPMLNVVEYDVGSGEFPVQPGDEILGRRAGMSNAEVLDIYDLQHGEYVQTVFEREEWQP